MPVPAAAVTTTILSCQQVVARSLVRCAVGERSSSVTTGLSGQSEHALGDDVALDLVRSAVDRVGAGEQEQPLPVASSEFGVRVVGRRIVPGRAATPRPALPWPARRARGASWPRAASRPTPRAPGPASSRQGAQRVRPHHLQPDPGAGELLADAGVVGRAVGFAPARRSPLQLAGEADLLARAWTRRARSVSVPSRPASRRRAPRRRGRRRCGVVEEHLVELRGAGQLQDRPHRRRRAGRIGTSR